MNYTCRTNGPRSNVTRVVVQDGYKPGTRVPHMVDRETVWEPIGCGYPPAERAGDAMCGDCYYRNRGVTTHE